MTDILSYLWVTRSSDNSIPSWMKNYSSGKTVEADNTKKIRKLTKKKCLLFNFEHFFEKIRFGKTKLNQNKESVWGRVGFTSSQSSTVVEQNWSSWCCWYWFWYQCCLEDSNKSGPPHWWKYVVLVSIPSEVEHLCDPTNTIVLFIEGAMSSYSHIFRIKE